MDILDIKPSTLKVEIYHPASRKPTGVIFDVLPSDAPEVKKAQRSLLDRRIKSRNRIISAAEIEENAIETLTARITNIELVGDATIGGQKPEFSAELVRSLLEHGYIRSQLEEAIGDESGFFES